MKTININTSSKKYAIKLGNDILKDSGSFLSELDFQGKICIITDRIVEELYLNTLKKSLLKQGFNLFEVVIETSEKYKTMETVLSIYNQLSEFELTRKDMLIALGGGVVGDITGFVAATYLRGIQFVQIPTTLLSQVDSSVGGKTGVDLKNGKNLVGAFKQPELVIADIDLLNTLPMEQIASGMAEVIKAGFIRDEELVELLEKSNDFKQDLEEFILRAIQVKKEIVEVDEFEKHERMLLNFGHTFGHAIEKYYHFDGISHGAAVAIGMCLITKSQTVLDKLIKILNKYHLPTNTDIPMEAIIQNSKNDKKSEQDKINIVVVERIGNGEIVKLDFESLRRLYG